MKKMDVSAQKSKKGTTKAKPKENADAESEFGWSGDNQRIDDAVQEFSNDERLAAVPFAKFNADISAGINTLNALAKSLKEVLGYDPKTKALKNPWAKHFTYESSIQPLLSLVKTLTECSPAEMDGQDFLSAKQVAIKNKKTVAA